MVELASNLIPAFFFLMIYRLFELYVRKEERMKIIEHMKQQTNIDGLNEKLNLPFFGKGQAPTFSILRAALLMIGIGLGLITAFCIEIAITDPNSHNQLFLEFQGDRIRNYMTVIYPASVILFGGIGLLISYLIERKADKK